MMIYSQYENGGGAFLIPYLIVLLLIGKPLYFLEMILGQFSSYGSVKVWAIVPLAKGKIKFEFVQDLHKIIQYTLPISFSQFVNSRCWIWWSYSVMVDRHLLLLLNGSDYLLLLFIVPNSSAVDRM